ncbi:MAG: peptide chain release factor N(5)-glutamine methyltransferase [Acidaminococcaceae bacterium]
MAQTQTKAVWTIIKILDWTKQYFADKGIENPRLDAEVLLCAVLKCPRIDLFVHFDQPLEEEELKAYRGFVARRGKQEPLAYILGEKGFMHYNFKVTAATLVPRPETELLVEQLSLWGQKCPQLRLLDVGTGSGAIIISLLALLPQAEGLAVDISPAALAVATENAQTLGVKERFTPLVSDLYGSIPQGQQFDVIVSNPPYIPTSDLAGLALDVQREPRGALDGGADGLVFYRRLLAGAGAYLSADGLLAFEVGIYQAQVVAELCRQQGFAVTAISKDYAGIERMVFATKEGTCYADAVMALNRP